MHAQMKHTLTNLQNLINSLAGCATYNYIRMLNKVGINYADWLKNAFHLCMLGCTYPAELCMYV